VAAAAAWAHKVVLDVTNYYEPRDGADLRPGPGGTSAEVQRKLAGALVVKAFNNLPARMLREPARQGDERVAIPIAADDDGAARSVETLIADMGFAPVRVGTLVEAAGPLDVGGPVFGAVLGAPELRAALGLI
jgi:predicted dinucleotide-binding enzyme